MHRIRALKDFNDVKAGDLGGFVESTHNLSQHGLCWVRDQARVKGNAQVLNQAQVLKYASIEGNARISGNAWVEGHVLGMRE